MILDIKWGELVGVEGDNKHATVRHKPSYQFY